MSNISTPSSTISSEPLFSHLGIHGWDTIEPALLACVMLGEPFCLISEPGSGKTYLGEVLAKALGEDFSYGYYDTSKTNFEDFIGFPNPEAFKAGRAEFIHNEVTIWDKHIIMLDEISRAARDTSNKWLEILGSRMLMGRPLPLRVVIGAMNPIEHQGTHPLDEAFADRFTLFIRLPEFATMDDHVRAAILGGSTGLDAPSVDFWADGSSKDKRLSYVTITEAFERAAARLRNVLQEGARHYRAMENEELAGRVTKYADLFAKSLTQAGVSLEPRRLKMLKRGILAAVAIRKAQLALAPDETLSEEELLAIAELVAACSMPHPYTAHGELTSTQLKVAHVEASSALKGDVKEMALVEASSQAEKLRRLLTSEFPGTLQEKVCSDFLADDSAEADMTALALAPLLVCPQVAEVLPASLVNKLAQRYVNVEMHRSTTAPLKIDEDLDRRFEEYAKVDELIKNADDNHLDRLACAWALARGAGAPAQILLYFDQAREALISAASEFQPVAAKWGVPGSDTWEAPSAPLLVKR